MKTLFYRHPGPAHLACVAVSLLLVALIAAGCGQSNTGGPEDSAADIKFPEFVYRSEEALKGYKIAAVNQDVIEKVPCYCGCVLDSEKYQNLKDCFYNRNTGDFDEHAAGCTTCLDEAKDIGQWRQEGLSVKDIRQNIDEKYAERGEPTHTPPIP